MLILALSDQLEQHLTSAFTTAEATLPRLHDEYSRAYYHGILCERRAKVLWRRSAAGSSHSVYGWLHEAMAHYERASALRPAGHDDAILRWNTCARILNAHPELQPAPRDTRVELLE